jgi:hypothetical protein
MWLFSREKKLNHRQESVSETGDRIAGIAQSTEAASIGLLAAIDGTVDAMQGVAKVMAGFATMIAGAAQEIAAKQVTEGEYIDPDDVAIDAMQRAADQLKTFLTKLVMKRAAIDRDGRLKDHHCEALHDAYEEATAEVANLVEDLLVTRSAIIVHDMKAEPREGSAAFATVDALIESLRGK